MKKLIKNGLQNSIFVRLLLSVSKFYLRHWNCHISDTCFCSMLYILSSAFQINYHSSHFVVSQVQKVFSLSCFSTPLVSNEPDLFLAFIRYSIRLTRTRIMGQVCFGYTNKATDVKHDESPKYDVLFYFTNWGLPF